MDELRTELLKAMYKRGEKAGSTIHNSDSDSYIRHETRIQFPKHKLRSLIDLCCRTSDMKA